MRTFVYDRKVTPWLLAALVVMLVSPAAAVVYVNANATGSNTGADWANAYTTIGAAVADPRSATEHIWIAAAEYTERLNIPTARTLLCGFSGGETEERQRQPESNTVSLNGLNLSGTGSMVVVQNANAVVIDGLEINGGEATGSGDERSGGGIRAGGTAAVLTLVNCRVLNNTAVDGGGVGVLGGASVRLDNCVIAGNEALDDGGGIYVTASSTVTVVSSLIQSNHTSDSGGGLYASVGSAVTIEDCKLITNTSGDALTGQGGAVYLREGVTGTFRKSLFVDNHAGARGGGIGAERSSLSLSDSRFLTNAIDGSGDQPDTYRGAGLYAVESLLDVDHAIFQGNQFLQHGRGGGIALVDCANAQFAYVMLSNNDAEIGGGLHCENSAPVIDRSIWIDNGAPGSGGVVFARANSTITFINGFFSGNNGPASFDMVGGSHLTLNSCTVTRNYSPVLLGDTASAELRNTIFDRNQGTAVEETTVDSDATILHCLFYENSTADVIDEGIVDFTGAAAINTFVDGATGVVDGDPFYHTDSDTNPTYNFSSRDFGIEPGSLVLEGVSPPLTENALAGRYVVLEDSAKRIFLVKENSADSVTLYFYGGFPAPGTFRLLDPTPEIDSPAVDAGISEGAPPVDFDGRPRPVDLPGFGEGTGLTFDIGAFETPRDRLIEAVFVRANPRPVQNGLTWDHAYGSIQTAIDDPRSQFLPIFVEEGTYNEILVLQSDRRIYGGFGLGGTDPANRTAQSTVDATGITPPNHVVTMINVQNTLLSYLIFTFGNASGAAGTPEGNGGGLYASGVDNSNRIEICRFPNNFAVGNGGGMALELSSPEITSCIIEGNYAGNGGGLALAGGAPAVSNSFLRNNSATTRGGGLFLDSGATLTINQGIVSGNNASQGGNIAVVDNALLELDKSVVFQGGASQQGGGLYVGNGSVVVRDGVIGNNAAALAGGGIYLDDGAGLTVSQCEINVNKVTTAGDGGGMAVGQGASVSAHNCLFRANTTGDGRGAGLFLARDSITNIFQNTFIANATGTNGLGGGLYSEAVLSSAPIAQCNFLRNTAWIGGGAYLKGANHSLIQCRLIRNHATGDGGGVYFNGMTQRNLEDCLLYRNTADDDGGGMYILQGVPGVYNCTFQNNQCVDEGGGLLVDRAAPSLVNNVFAGNTPSGVYEQNSTSDPAQLAFNFFDTPGIFYVDEGITNLASAEAINNLANANDNRSGNYKVAEDVYYLAGKITSYGTGSSDTGRVTLYLKFDDGLYAEPGQFYGPLHPQSGELAGQFLSVDGRPDILYRIYENSGDRVTMRDIPVGVQLGQTFRIHDFVPLPTTDTVDNGTADTPSMADLRGVPRPYVVHPGQGAGVDIGAYEVAQLDLVGWLKDVLLGKATILDESMTTLLDVNQDGQLDIGDIVTFLATVPTV